MGWWAWHRNSYYTHGECRQKKNLLNILQIVLPNYRTSSSSSSWCSFRAISFHSFGECARIARSLIVSSWDTGDTVWMGWRKKKRRRLATDGGNRCNAIRVRSHNDSHPLDFIEPNSHPETSHRWCGASARRKMMIIMMIVPIGYYNFNRKLRSKRSQRKGENDDFFFICFCCFAGVQQRIGGCSKYLLSS